MAFFQFITRVCAHLSLFVAAHAYSQSPTFLNVLAPVNNPASQLLQKSWLRVEFYTHPWELLSKIKQEPKKWDGVLCYEDELPELKSPASPLIMSETLPIFVDPFVLFWDGNEPFAPVNNWEDLFHQNTLQHWRQKLTFVGPEKWISLFSHLVKDTSPSDWLGEFLKNKTLSQKKPPQNIISKEARAGIMLLSQFKLLKRFTDGLQFSIPSNVTWYRQLVLAIPQSSQQTPEESSRLKKTFIANSLEKRVPYLRPEPKWRAWPLPKDPIWEQIDKTTPTTPLAL